MLHDLHHFPKSFELLQGGMLSGPSPIGVTKHIYIYIYVMLHDLHHFSKSFELLEGGMLSGPNPIGVWGFVMVLLGPSRALLGHVVNQWRPCSPRDP